MGMQASSHEAQGLPLSEQELYRQKLFEKMRIRDPHDIRVALELASHLPLSARRNLLDAVIDAFQTMLTTHNYV